MNNERKFDALALIGEQKKETKRKKNVLQPFYQWL